MGKRSRESELRRQKRFVIIVIILAGVVHSDYWLLTPDSQASQIKVDVNLVNVFATVQDERGTFITDLKREDFRVYDDGVLQDVGIFETENDVKSTIGFLMDSSGSMVDLLPLMKTGIRDYTRSMPPSDDFFVASFGTNVRLLHTSPQGQKHLEDSLTPLRAYGTSLMYDGLMFAMGKIQRTQPERKALIVFSDGNDNGSEAGHGRVVEEAQSTGVLIYFVAIGSKVLIDSHTIEDLSNVSGGRVAYVAKPEPLTPVLNEIKNELSRQYYLGYYITRRAGFHRIRVEVPGRNVKIRAKTGYLG